MPKIIIHTGESQRHSLPSGFTLVFYTESGEILSEVNVSISEYTTAETLRALILGIFEFMKHVELRHRVSLNDQQIPF